MTSIRIDPEFRALIPPLSAEERQQLEANLKADGCRDPLVTWDGVLLDGHNRYDICTRYGISYRTVERPCKDRNDALAWIIHNQLGRRSLPPFARAELARRLEPVIAAEADARKRLANTKEQRQARAIRHEQRGEAEPKHKKRTEERVARLAGMSSRQYRKAKVLMDEASEPVKAGLRAGYMKIATEYNKLRSAAVPSPSEQSASRTSTAPTFQECRDAFVLRAESAVRGAFYPEVPVTKEVLETARWVAAKWKELVEKLEQQLK